MVALVIVRSNPCRSGKCAIGGNLGSGISHGINRMIIAARAADVRQADRGRGGCQNAVGNSYGRFGSSGMDAHNDYGKSQQYNAMREGKGVGLGA